MDHLTVIGDESERFATVLAVADAQARVPSCPDWNAADLLWHLTTVQHFWSRILAEDARSDEAAGAIEEAEPERPESADEMLPRRAAATAALLEQLRLLDDDEPRWSWFESDQTVGFTRRMQTYEATMHRVDAELAAGRPLTPLAAEVAAGAVGHAVDVMWGWKPDWAPTETLATVEFVATDTDQRWLVDVGHWFGTGPESGKQFDEPLAVPSAGGDPTATVTGTANDLALWAWTRGGDVSITGTEPAKAALARIITQGMP